MDEHRVATALRDALPTRRHADMLFDMVVDRLGDAARIESAPDGNHRILYRLDGSDPRRVIPWPLLTLSRNPRQTMPLDIPGLEPAPPLPPRPGKAPNLRGLGPGYIQLQDGSPFVQVAYAEDGRWFETSRGGPASTLEGVIPLLAAGGAPPVERIAEFVAAIDVARRGPMRVLLRDHGAWSAWSAWFVSLPRLRTAIQRGTIPPDARWAAIDPVDGRALAWGPTRDDALFAWSAQVERVRPGSLRRSPDDAPTFEPPAPPELPGAEDSKTISFRIEIGSPGYDPLHPPPPPPAPETIPAVVIELPAPPASPCPLGAWRRLLGAGGGSVFAGLREDPSGWTLASQRTLAALALPDIESGLDEADRAWERQMKEGRRLTIGSPSADIAWDIHCYRFFDEDSGKAVAPVVIQVLGTRTREVPVLDGDVLDLGAARARPKPKG